MQRRWIRITFPALPLSIKRSASLPYLCWCWERSVFFCLFRLPDLIAALIITRIIFQFLLQAVGLVAFRKNLGGQPNPFRMPLYPIPALLAIAGFLFVLLHGKNLSREIEFATGLLLTGLLIFGVRAIIRREWPFAAPAAGTAPN